jgi:prepilin-type N-terminal cleavage/methylation domain-containing protein
MISRAARRQSAAARGFSLIELAIAIVVIAVFLSAVMVPLTTQVDQRKTGDTQRMLEEIKEALIGFTLANGRLPCPASAASNGVENPLGGGVCTNPNDGFVPGATLALTGLDAQGYAVDSWGTRIRYAVTIANANAFTTNNGIRTLGMGSLAPSLWVCPTATGITANDCGAGNAFLANSAVAVIHSSGPNWATGGGADEAANLNADQVFVSHQRSGTNAPNGEFDDLVTWLSPTVLFSRMVSAGRLP